MTEFIKDFLAICAGISCIGAAVGWIIKAVKAVKAPAQQTGQRLDAIEQKLETHEQCLATDKERLDGIDRGSRVTQKAILALLQHGIDGNDVEAMKRAKDELQQYLIERA